MAAFNGGGEEDEEVDAEISRAVAVVAGGG